MKQGSDPPDDRSASTSRSESVDAITASPRDEAYDEAPGRQTKVGEATKEARFLPFTAFYNAKVHDWVVAIISIGATLGLTATAILAVTREIPNASYTALGSGALAVVVVVAVVLGQLYRPSLQIGRIND